MEVQNFHNRAGAWVNFYHFSPAEKKALKSMAKKEIARRKKLILAIENNPKNEGQVKYESKIRDHFNIIDTFNEFI